MTGEMPQFILDETPERMGVHADIAGEYEYVAVFDRIEIVQAAEPGSSMHFSRCRSEAIWIFMMSATTSRGVRHSTSASRKYNREMASN